MPRHNATFAAPTTAAKPQLSSYQRVLPRPVGAASPRAKVRRSQRLLSTHQTAVYSLRKPLRAAFRHRTTTQLPATSSGESGFLLALGAICMLGGLICLLISLFMLSGTLALTGLGVLALGVLLFSAGWGSGWAFG
ncbi:hypothetical protein [Hymenobacter saemangeumensis]